MNEMIETEWMMMDISGGIGGFSDIPVYGISKQWVQVSKETATYLRNNNIVNLNELNEAILASPNGTLMLLPEYEVYFGKVSIRNPREVYCICTNIEKIQRDPMLSCEGITFEEFVQIKNSTSVPPLTDIEKIIYSAVFAWWTEESKHKLYKVMPDAATLIANARLDGTETDLEPVYLYSADGYLFDVIRELLIYPEQGRLRIMAFNALQYCITCFVDEIVDDVEINEIQRKCVRYAKIFLELLKCEKSPIEIGKETEIDKVKQGNKPFRKVKPITYSSISLTKRYRYKKRKLQKKVNSNSKENKHLILTPISGHFRNQAFGTGFSQHRTIWVDEFVANRWVKNGLHYVTVIE